MALRETDPSGAGNAETTATPRMDIGVVTLLRLAEDQRDRVAEDVKAGKEFGPGEIDINRELLGVYKGWLKESGVLLLPEDRISADVLAGGDAELTIDHGQPPDRLAA